MSDTYTAADLINGALGSLNPPARVCIFGDPITHSKSPIFQNAALKAAGIDAQYVRVHATPEELAPALRALPANGFVGANITLPHKSAALAVMDQVDDYARTAGAVNTVAVEDGKLHGFNTDGPGLSRAIREEFQVDLRDLRIMVLGAGGGAGRAIAAQCAVERCERLVLVNRTVEKAKDVAMELAPLLRSDRLLGPSDRLIVAPHEISFLREEIEMTDLVINATSLGMKRTDAPVLPPELLSPHLMIYDTVYSAGMSRLVEDAIAAGARATNGLSMLLHQGALAFEIWFDRSAPLEVMRAALKDA